jgi:serine/threonine-protein kinase
MSKSEETTHLSPGGRSLSSPSDAAAGRFPPGTILDERYRIIGLVGRGGMGEVYRADDLRLGQAVALKFLPEELARDAQRLALLHNEVRAARQVSHPNICRVYDIGGRDGQLYLSMEFVDGEDLAASLRRFGRLPEDKALDIARQLCAGLMAAHERGVLHRDLKPANVMIDGEGRVRIMDFSLASIGAAEATRAGTPRYMAPEQLKGKPATAASDIFALGLVLYEIFTGRRAFTAKHVADLAVQHSLSVPPLSEYVPAIDPAIERTVLMCLQFDPDERPQSAFAVAALLPGADMLAMAMATGQTPSPEMVAAAGGKGAALTHAQGAAWLAALVAMLFVSGQFADRATAPGQSVMKKPTAALTEIASQTRRLAVGEHAAAYDATGFQYDRDALKWYDAHGGPAEGWRQMAGGNLPAIRFWHRTSLAPIDPLGDFGYISLVDPPPIQPGDTVTELDTEGRLLSLLVRPTNLAAGARGPQGEATTVTAGADWSPLFAAAGLTFAEFTSSAPRFVPPLYVDRMLAWDGPAPFRPEGRVHVDAASIGPSPVWFVVQGPWSTGVPLRASTMVADGMSAAASLVQVSLMVLMMGLAVLSVRANRADRRGAFRIAALGFAVELLVWALTPAHSPDAPRELYRFFTGVAFACFFGVLFGAAYLGLEPYVRRYWPKALVAWTRLLSGRFTDPLVGRDVLIGVTCGFVMASVTFLYQAVPLTMGWLSPSGWLPSMAPASGIGGALARPMYLFDFSLLNGLFGTFIMAVLRHRVRWTWLAIVAWIVVVGLLYDETAHIDAGTVRFLLFNIACSVVPALVLVRFGLLAFTTTCVANNFVTGAVFTVDPSRAYFAACLLPAAALTILGLAAWRNATRKG